MRECWLTNQCNHRDCDTFCMRNYKLSHLYDNALISMGQRERRKLFYDSNGVDKVQFEYLSNIESHIEEFIESGDNLYIHSVICGNGKTSWALRLAQAYLNKIWIKSGIDDCKVLFINVPRFLIALKDNIDEKNDYIKHIKDNVLLSDLVIWDEVGTKSLTTFEHENVLNLINARIDMGKSNIYTSNLTNEELHNTVGDRLYSRIVNYSNDICLMGLDKRAL